MLVDVNFDFYCSFFDKFMLVAYLLNFIVQMNGIWLRKCPSMTYYIVIIKVSKQLRILNSFAVIL